MERVLQSAAALVLLLALVVAPPPPGVRFPPIARAGDGAEVGAVRRLLKETDPRRRAAALRRLAGLDGRAAQRLLVEGLADPHPYVRRAAAGVLGATDPTRRRRLALELARCRKATARAEACRVLALWADDVGCAGLLTALGDPDAQVRAEAVRWLADDPGVSVAGRPADDGPAGKAARALGACLEDRDGEVRASALAALVARPGFAPWPEALPPLLSFLGDGDHRVRMAALEGLVARASSVGSGDGGGPSRARRAPRPSPDASAAGDPSSLEGCDPAVVAVSHGLEDAVWSVRLLAAELSRRVRHPGVLPPLIRALSDERRRVAAAAHGTLVALTGIPFDSDPAPWQAWLAADGATFDPSGSAGGGPADGRPAEGRPAERGADGSADSVRRHGGGGRTVALPRFHGLALVSRHVGFVLDASGSMARRIPGGPSRWTRACEELERALDDLDGSRINVWRFHDTVESAFDRAVVPTAARRRTLRRWLAQTRPAGRTALFDGMAAALADPDIDTIVVLSDGAPSAGSFFTKTDLLQETRRLNRWRRARIDVIALGGDGVAARWRGVLRELAEDSGGVCLRRW